MEKLTEISRTSISRSRKTSEYRKLIILVARESRCGKENCKRRVVPGGKALKTIKGKSGATVVTLFCEQRRETRYRTRWRRHARLTSH